MSWEEQTVKGMCTGCHKPIHPGEPARLLTKRPGRFCWLCARKRLMETAPADLRRQVVMPKRIHVDGAKFVDNNFDGFDRTAIGATVRNGIIERRESERAELNAKDGRLRQVGSE